jgi:acetyl-CoA carboxylase carboxyl transferase subunit alpha
VRLEVVDEVLPEPLGGAHRDPAAAAASLRDAVSRHLERLAGVSASELVDRRLARFRRMGVFRTVGA